MNQVDFLPPLCKIEAIDFRGIIDNFNKKRSNYNLPRIVFLGQFEFLSLTDQRYLCSGLGFEDFHNLVSLHSETNDEDDKAGSLLGMWRGITKDFTKLVVIGNVPTKSIKNDLYKAFKKRGTNEMDLPLIEKYDIPVIMESEIIKIHPDYPNINKSTLWKNIIPIV